MAMSDTESTDSRDKTRNFGPYSNDTFDLDSFGADSIGDTKFPASSPNFQKLFSQRDHNIERKDLYHSSKRRKIPTKKNKKTRDNHEMPPLTGDDGDQVGSVNAQDNSIAARATRSKKPDGIENKPPDGKKKASLEKEPDGPHIVTEREVLQVARENKIPTKYLEEWAESFIQHDKALNKTQLLETLQIQRKEVYVARKLYSSVDKVKTKLRVEREQLLQNQANLVQEKEGLLQQLDQNQADHDKIVQDLELRLHKALTGKKGRAGGKDKKVEQKVFEKAKIFGWNRVKFIQSEVEEINACKLVVKFGMFDKDLVNTKQKRADFVMTYKTLNKQAIFQKRNYVTSEIKKMFMKRAYRGEQILTLEDLVMCLQRNIKSEEDMQKFMIYWEEYLGREVGAMDWNDKTKYYVTICKAMRKDNPKMELITPSAEAFLVVCIHNGMGRWQREFEAKMAASNGQAILEKELLREDKKTKYDGLFTSTTNGQNQYGGWSGTGLDFFLNYRAMNEQARLLPNCAEKEKDCLARLRKEHGIEDHCTSALDHLRNKEAKKRLAKRGRADEPLPPRKRVVHTLELVESSEDEDEEEDD